MSRSTVLRAVMVLCGAGAGCGAPITPVTGNPAVDAATAPSPDMAVAQNNQGNPTDLTITLPGFDLQPGEEKILCYYVPPDGVDRWVNEFDITMAKGSHHLIVFRVPGKTTDVARGPEACQTPIPIGMLPGSQEPVTTLPMPEGMAFRVDSGSGLYFQSHYINASPTDVLHTAVTYSLKTIDAAAVTTMAGEFFYNISSLMVPPGMSTVTATCKAPHDLNILYATGHMHMHATLFDSTVGGAELFSTKDWNEPSGGSYPAPGYAVAMGTPITWTCDYNNLTTDTLHFGDSAIKNEMCILAGLYYPANNSSTIFCQK